MWQIVGAVCLSLAPCTPLLFLGIKFEIIHNTWIINQNNFVGLFLAISFILMWIAACFCISNLTLDPIYQQIKCEILEKAHENVTFAKDEEKQKDLENISDDILITHKLWTLKNVLKRADVFLVLFSSAILMGQYFQAEVLINMISLYHFNFTMSKLAFATVIGVFTSTLLLAYIRKRFLSNSVDVHFMFIMTYVLMMVVYACLNLIKELTIENFPIQIMVISMIVLLNSITTFARTCYGRLILFSITPSHSASIIESYRKASGGIFTFICFLTASYAYSYQFYITWLHSAVLVIFVWYFTRKRYYYIQNFEKKRQ
eukprot:TCONS_00072343-protein